MKTTFRFLIASVLITFLTVHSSDAQIILKFEGGIQGECTLKGYEDQVVANSIGFSSGFQAPEGTATDFRNSPPKSELSSIYFTKNLDLASAKLLRKATTGSLIPSVDIHVLRTAGTGSEKPEPYLKIKLSQVRVAHYGISGSDDGIPNEDIELLYQKIEFVYMRESKVGTLEMGDSFSYDILKGRER